MRDSISTKHCNTVAIFLASVLRKANLAHVFSEVKG